MQKDGGWVFISHSHQDIERVRKIRNRLESLGFEPLMLFLKSLDDDDEIDAREWFIYVDSPTARESRWVRTEREHVASLSGKKVFTISLDRDLDEQVDYIARQLKVFISYSHADASVATKIRDALVHEEFLVWNDEELRVSEDWTAQINNEMRDAARNGFAVVVISAATASSAYVRDEIESLVELRSKIAPVYVDDPPLPAELRVLIGDLQGVSVSKDPDEKQIAEVVTSVIHRVEFYRSDFRDSLGYRSACRVTLPPIGTIDNLTFWDNESLQEVVVPNSVSYISDDAFRGHEDVLVKCHEGSYALRWCREHGQPFQVIE